MYFILFLYFLLPFLFSTVFFHLSFSPTFVLSLSVFFLPFPRFPPFYYYYFLIPVFFLVSFFLFLSLSLFLFPPFFNPSPPLFFRSPPFLPVCVCLCVCVCAFFLIFIFYFVLNHYYFLIYIYIYSFLFLPLSPLHFHNFIIYIICFKVIFYF